MQNSRGTVIIGNDDCPSLQWSQQGDRKGRPYQTYGDGSSRLGRGDPCGRPVRPTQKSYKHPGSARELDKNIIGTLQYYETYSMYRFLSRNRGSTFGNVIS